MKTDKGGAGGEGYWREWAQCTDVVEPDEWVRKGVPFPVIRSSLPYTHVWVHPHVLMRLFWASAPLSPPVCAWTLLVTLYPVRGSSMDSWPDSDAQRIPRSCGARWTVELVCGT